MFSLFCIDAHPLRKPTLHHPVNSRQSGSCSCWKSGNPGISEFQIVSYAFQEISPVNLLPHSFYALKGRSLFETVRFSTAQISESQVETCPAEGPLDSLSHSSLTHKQLVTHAARFFTARRSFLLFNQCICTLAKFIFLIIL